MSATRPLFTNLVHPRNALAGQIDVRHGCGHNYARLRVGASTTTTFLDFQDQQKCSAAATALATTTDPTFPGGEHVRTATYRIIAKCVVR
jgi:hypothetical protein